MTTNIKQLAAKHGLPEKIIQRFMYKGKLDQLEKFKAELQAKETNNKINLKNSKRRLSITLDCEVSETFFVQALIEYIESSYRGIEIKNYKVRNKK